MANVTDASAYARELQGLADKLSDLQDLTENSQDNPIADILMTAGPMLLERVQQNTPVWTGLLQEMQVLSPVEVSSKGAGVEAEMSLYIDPDPTRDHSILKGTFPYIYGERYHQQTRPWMHDATDSFESDFNDLVYEAWKSYLHKAVL